MDHETNVVLRGRLDEDLILSDQFADVGKIWEDAADKVRDLYTVDVVLMAFQKIIAGNEARSTFVLRKRIEDYCATLTMEMEIYLMLERLKVSKYDHSLDRKVIEMASYFRAHQLGVSGEHLRKWSEDMERHLDQKLGRRTATIQDLKTDVRDRRVLMAILRTAIQPLLQAEAA